MKEVLIIHVKINEIQDVKGHRLTACMIPFGGTAQGPYFQGKVLPHGVDTQKIYPGEKPLLSARYFLEGKDFQGNDCRIFVENNGQEGADGVLATRPFLVTDSPALTWLETAELSGTVEPEEGGVRIQIFAEEDSQESPLIPGRISYTAERVLIAKGDKQICGRLYLPKTEKPCPAVIASHGYNGSHQDFFMECAFFASHGIAALAFDFCGGSVTSASSGTTTEMSVLTEKSDLEDVLEAVRRIRGVDPDSVFLLGASQGGMVSALTAAAHPEQVKGMILYYPAFCIPDDWKKTYPSEEELPDQREFWNMELGKIYFQDVRDLDPYEEIGRFEKKVLILHGDADDVVPVEYSKRAEACYPQAKLEILPGEGHGFCPAESRKAAKKILEFITAGQS